MDFSISQSAVRTAYDRFSINSHNVANVNTTGFSQSTPFQKEGLTGGTAISHVNKTPNSATMPSNTDLAQVAGETINDRNASSANLSVIKAKNRMLGEVIDILA